MLLNEMRRKFLRGVLAISALAGALGVSATAAAQAIPTMHVIQDSRLFWVASQNGDAFDQLGGVVWGNTSSAAAHGGADIYAIQDGTLKIVNTSDALVRPFPGPAGGEGGWFGPTRMVAHWHNLRKVLWIVQDSGLWRVDVETGEYTLLGGAGWDNTTSMAYSEGGWLMIIQDAKLWRVNPSSGAATPLSTGTGWSGPTVMSSGDGRFVYAIQDDVLWRIDPNGPVNANFTALTGAIWHGATSMGHVLAPHSGPGELRIIQNDRIYQVRLQDNSVESLSGPAWNGPTEMIIWHSFLH